jgi:hypothetical protein
MGVLGVEVVLKTSWLLVTGPGLLAWLIWLKKDTMHYQINENIIDCIHRSKSIWWDILPSCDRSWTIIQWTFLLSHFLPFGCTSITFARTRWPSYRSFFGMAFSTSVCNRARWWEQMQYKQESEKGIVLPLLSPIQRALWRCSPVAITKAIFTLHLIQTFGSRFVSFEL